MAASSSSSFPKFDVFLSFSAQDTTNTFVSDLYSSLSEKRITVYYKDDNNPEETTVSPFGSKLAVVVVSQSYPTSFLCLNELQTILNLHDNGQLSVLLIYYGVDPLDVINQTGVYAESFKQLGEEHSAQEVEAWKKALTKLTNLSGLDSRFWSQGAKMVDLITSEILLLVSGKKNSPSTNKADGTVALDRHMKDLYELLDLESNNEVRLVGIWGPGGVGKTTLARYAYEEMSVNFHAHMFIDNSEKNYQLTVGAGDMKSALGHRKGLLVIDCVDKLEQLNDLVKVIGWFGSGSRVILVTQKKELLDEFGVEHIYELETLRYDEALQLFSHSAFKQQNPPTNFESLSLRAVQVASFLPLSLKILGSSLQGKDENTWEEELAKFEGEEEKTIMEIMKRSNKEANE